jgi:hypothetical protein
MIDTNTDTGPDTHDRYSTKAGVPGNLRILMQAIGKEVGSFLHNPQTCITCKAELVPALHHA